MYVFNSSRKWKWKQLFYINAKGVFFMHIATVKALATTRQGYNMHTHTHTHACRCIHAHTNAIMHAHAHAHTRTQTCACIMHVHTDARTCKHAHAYACACTHTHMGHIHACTCTCMHVQACMHMQYYCLKLILWAKILGLLSIENYWARLSTTN